MTQGYSVEGFTVLKDYSTIRTATVQGWLNSFDKTATPLINKLTSGFAYKPPSAHRMFIV